MLVTTYENSFSSRVIQTWNSLPDSVVASSSINSFKIKVTLISVGLVKKSNTNYTIARPNSLDPETVV